MLRTTDASLSALVSPFQVGLGAICSYNYDLEASEERSSDEHYDGAVHTAKLAHSGSRSFGATSSVCRAAPRTAAVACASWIPSFLAATYFQPCERHRHHKKNECTFFCITCGARPHSVCQHCMGAHAGHQVIQVRRYVYCDVVRACDISPYMDATGVQNYIINSAKVMFLNHRPHSKIGRANGVDICRTCHRHLREGYSYCSLACKVEALTKGETAPGDGAAAGAHRTGVSSVAAAVAAPATALGQPLLGSGSSPRSRPLTSSYSPCPRSTVALTSRGSSGLLAAAAMTAVAAPDSPEMAAGDASCAALSSDPESSDPGEDTFAFGGGSGGGTSRLAPRGGIVAAAPPVGAVRRRLPPALPPPPPPRDLDDSSNGSASSRDDDCYEFNFSNPPKRRRSHTITRRPSSSNGYSATGAVLCAAAAAAAAAAGGDSEAEAAATAAATLLLPFRTGALPAAPEAPPAASRAALAAAAVAVSPGMLLCTTVAGCEDQLPAVADVSALDLSRAVSAPAGFSSRRKQHAPQRAPSF